MAPWATPMEDQCTRKAKRVPTALVHAMMAYVFETTLTEGSLCKYFRILSEEDWNITR